MQELAQFLPQTILLQHSCTLPALESAWCRQPRVWLSHYSTET